VDAPAGNNPESLRKIVAMIGYGPRAYPGVARGMECRFPRDLLPSQDLHNITVA
jgi:hypothetical protein